MPSSRQVISEFVQRGYIQPKQINEALICTQVFPGIKSWFKFIDRLLLSLGALALGFAVLFFIAYNWNEFGRFAKFTLLEVLLAGAVFAYWRSPKNSLSSQVSLLMSSLFTGVLMAFFGQTYQTGADPWTLFFYWALLITPWVIIARFAPLWLSWLALLNIALSLYTDSFGSPLSFFFGNKHGLLLALFILNSCALLSLELTSKRFDYLSSRWIARIIASICGFMITMFYFENITSSISSLAPTSKLPLILWASFIIALYVAYRHLHKDLFMLAGGCLSSIVIITTLFIQETSNDWNEGLLLVTALLIISLTSLATFWLKRVHKTISL
jgi:uncharacterized membrane protein